MRTVAILMVMLGLAGLCVSAVHAQPARADSRATVARIPELVRLLERQPLRPGADSMRSALMCLMIDSPDITLHACDDLLALCAGARGPMRDLLLTQTLLSSASYMIMHPDSAANRLAVARAGVLGVLRAYEAMLRTGFIAAVPALDMLAEQRDYGDFDAYLTRLIAPCAAR